MNLLHGLFVWLFNKNKDFANFFFVVKHGTLIGGHRIGADSNFGLNEAEGVDIKNSLNVSWLN